MKKTAAVLLMLAGCCVAFGAPADSRHPPKLKANRSFEKELSGGGEHSYRISLKRGQYVEVVVEQKGIDIVLTLIGPDGAKLEEVDSPNGSEGNETLSYVANRGGKYVLKVSSLDKQAAAARYAIKISELRAATDKDRSKATAERAFREAMNLKAQQTAESLNKSIEKYEEALRLWRAAGERDFEGLVLNNLAEVYYSLGNRKKALDLFGEGLAIMRATGSKAGEAAVLSNIAVVYEDLGDNKKSLESYMAALPLRREAGDKAGEAVTLSNIGVLYSHTGENEKGVDYFNQALVIVRSLGNRPYEISILNNLAATYADLGEVQKSLENYDQAMKLVRAAGDRSAESSVANGLGNLYLSQGDTSKALEVYNRSLALSREVGDRSKEAVALGNIGLAYDTAGEKKKALEHFENALKLIREVGDPRKEAETISNIGVLYNSIDENEKALEYFDKAIPLLRAVGDRSGEATTINNIGSVYDRIGESQKALEYYNQSLEIVRSIGERRTEGVLLDNIGAVYELLNDHQRALDFHNQSISIANDVGDKATLATALRNAAIAERALGSSKQAIEHLNLALDKARSVGNPRLIGSALNNLGETLLLAGDAENARGRYSEAIPLWRGAGDLTGEAGALYGLARVEKGVGNLQLARQNIEAALGLIESLRLRYKRQEMRSSYFASVQKYYEFYIDLLMRMHRARSSDGNDAVAFAASERAKARGLLDILTEANADIRQGIDPGLLERERTLQQQLNARAQLQMQLAAGRNNADQLKAASREVQNLTAQFEELEAQIRKDSPRYAALTQPRPLGIREIQDVILDQDSLLLEYSLGEERSYLWVVSKTGLRTYELPRRDQIEKVAQDVYSQVTKPNKLVSTSSSDQKRGLRVVREAKNDTTLLDAIRKLSQLILAPAAAELASKRLLIVADGTLQYIPFAALTAATSGTYRPIVVDHEIIGLPSASVLSVLRDDLRSRKTADKILAVLADPVFEANDERIRNPQRASRPENRSKENASQRGLSIALAKGAAETGISNGPTIPRLPGTRQEAEGILALVPEAATRKATDFDASKATAMSEDLGRYRLVHFATHGFLDSVNPQLSGLVLSLFNDSGDSQNGFLRAHEIYNLKLGADLVVLSACQTGLGKQVRGEGLVGLTRGFMYAGAARVAVSLWSVDDEATSTLMRAFYKRMLVDHLKPSAALRAAQIEMFQQAKWQAPYYWAAFVIQGEWK